MESIEPIQPPDLVPTAELLAASFLDNPCYAYMHPRADARHADLRAFFVRNLRWRLALGMTWVARVDGRVLGTCSLEPPGGVPHSAGELVRHWLVPTLREQGPHTASRIVRADRFFGQALRGVAAGRAYWHIHAVAVAPDVRSRGLGTRLMRTLLAFAARHRAPQAPLLLATQLARNVRFYTQFGFEVAHRARLASTFARQGFETWFMRA